MASLYDIIADLRREHPTPAGSKTLDLAVAELGRTRDNLKDALASLESRPVPAGGKVILDELARRARSEGIDNLRTPLSREEMRALEEPIDESQIGIALLLGASSLVSVGLALAAVVIGVNSLTHFIK